MLNVKDQLMRQAGFKRCLVTASAAVVALSMALFGAGCGSDEPVEVENQFPTSDPAIVQTFLEAIYQSNDPAALLVEQGDAITADIVETNAEGTVVQTGFIQQYYADGKLWSDDEWYDGEGNLLSANSYYYNDDVSYGLYCYTDGVDNLLVAMSEDTYKAALCFNPVLTVDISDTDLISLASVDQLEETMQLTYTAEFSEGYFTEVVYVVDKASLVLQSIQETDYDADGKICRAVTRTFVQDEPRVTNAIGFAEVASFGEDACAVTIVVNPGSDAEETLNYSVKQGSTVFYDSNDIVMMYTDEACTQEILSPDTSGESCTVYVLLAEQLD